MRAAGESDRQYWQRVDEIFTAVAEMPPRERVARLDALCGSDADLRANVSRLLESDGGVEVGFLEPSVALRPPSSDGSGGSVLSAQPDVPTAQRWVGRRIGGFTLTRCLGVGGMGAVYEAVQERPRRTVALKLILGALASPQRLRRFVTEAEILADLHHPNIAQVYEAGTGEDAPDAAPYMALELIPEAASITEFVRARRWDIRARLDLFLQVCDAVQYLHQRGVIHRDLKPANILVDAAGRPRVIDFGVARLVEADPAATRFTEARQLVGTLAYMSPEQVRGDAAQVDTRSDVYALGVILFELLTGRPPYEVRGGNLPEAIRAIESAAPPRPGSLDPALRGDLETIVLKALRKDRERRYQSAAHLAEDLRRFLNNEPIEARPPSAAYQFRKLVARHKPLFASVGVLILFLIVFAGSMTVLYARAERNRLRAEEAEASSRAETQAARDVSASLVNLFQSLDPWSAAGSPDSPGGSTVLELLDREVRTLPEKLKNQPLTHADVLIAIATVYQRMELFGRASTALRSALELRRRALEFQDARVADAAFHLGGVLRTKGEFAAAEPFLREALSIRRHHAATNPNQPLPPPGMLTELSRVLVAQARLAEAELLDREALDIYRGVYGADDVSVVTGLRTVSITRRLADDGAGAETLCREALAGCARLTHKRSLHEFETLLELSAALRDQGRFLEAEESAREALDRAGGWEGDNEARAMIVVAALMRTRGDLDGAEALDRQSLEKFRKVLGPEHPNVSGMTYRLLQVLAEKGDRLGLEAIHQEFLTQYPRAFTIPEDHPARSGAALHLGHSKLYQGDPAGAEPLLRECVDLRRTALSAEHWMTAYAEGVLGACLTALGRYPEAEPLLLGADRLLRTQLGRMDYRSIYAVRGLAKLYEAWNAAEPGQGHDAKAAEWQAKLDP